MGSMRYLTLAEKRAVSWHGRERARRRQQIEYDDQNPKVHPLMYLEASPNTAPN
jgi:hypothetical protein